MNCDLPECIKAYREFVSESDEESNLKGYEEGSYTFMHCQQKNCHELFWKGKNGDTCNQCGKDVCEFCQTSSLNDEDLDDFVCQDCRLISRPLKS